MSEDKNRVQKPESFKSPVTHVNDNMRIFDIVWNYYQREEGVQKLNKESKDLVSGLAKQQVARQALSEVGAYSKDEVDKVSGVRSEDLDGVVERMRDSGVDPKVVGALRVRANNIAGHVLNPNTIHWEDCRSELLRLGLIVEVKREERKFSFKGKVYARLIPGSIDDIRGGTKPNEDRGWSALGKSSEDKKD